MKKFDEEFDEEEFMKYLDCFIGVPIREAENKVNDPDYGKANIAVEEAINDLSALELVCYLGKYLILKSHNRKCIENYEDKTGENNGHDEVCKQRK